MPSLCGAATLSVRSEVGGEYDSNPSRVETVANDDSITGESPSPSTGGRALIGGEFNARLASRTVLTLSGRAAGRGYLDRAASRERVGILSGTASLLQLVGASTRALGGVAYYDAYQDTRPESRDFRSTSPSLSLLHPLGPGRLSVTGGYRWFVFKPAPVLNFAGPTAAAAYKVDLGGEREDDDDSAEWEFITSVAYERRAFEALRCVKEDDCPPATPAGLRNDNFAQAGIDFVRTGDFLLGAGAAFQINASNSFQESLRRGLAHVEATFLLPWALSLATRAELIWTSFENAVPVRRDPVSGLPLASIEDEGRSTFRVELMRPLGDNVDLSLRWIGYTNAIGGGPVQYRRQVLLLQAGVSLNLL
ncbi:MAG: hypothetical protein SF187_06270 [Deltaproteobacteria bacterium]|nr:hypothetical protein [Deltaproteobacteria bacterium]